MYKLDTLLRKIDGKGYKNYNQIRGKYRFEFFDLFIDHIQADPYAPPTSVRARVSQQIAGFPQNLFKNRSRKTGLEDYLTRTFYKNAKLHSNKNGSGKSGLITITKPSQQILERTSIEVNKRFVEARFYVGLPAHGRKILGKTAKQIFFNKIPEIVESSLIYPRLNHNDIKHHVEVAEDADYIRNKLRERGLVAFIADNAILPRKTGVDEHPKEKAIPFKSPPSMQVEFRCPNRVITGMGIPEGITLIVGGGYHGKSTLLNALAVGVYNHIPDDGREFVITVEDAVKIRSEDGRYVENVDISCFISNLPDDRDTTHFSTENASGSTSQVAHIIEALEIGSRCLLIDEDTSATNLLIRDERMQNLIDKEKEPITPLIDLIKPLRQHGVSVILIMGGLGDYFDVADKVIMMDSYQPRDVTDDVKKIIKKYPSKRKKETPREIIIRDRYPNKKTIDPHRNGKIRIKTSGRNLLFGRETIDLSRIEQIVENTQIKTIGILMYEATKRFNGKPLRESLDNINKTIDNRGLLHFLPHQDGYTRPRKYEIAAAINRLRTMKILKTKNQTTQK
ncbi:MAG: ATPase [Thermoplasmata archaeon]|nr:MAG: ATPase [Thermoplasmata archaeon]